jgi:hypothetical protein
MGVGSGGVSLRLGVGGNGDGVALAVSVSIGTSGTGTGVDELVTVGVRDGFLASGGVAGITVVQAARANAARANPAARADGTMHQAERFTLRFSDTFTGTYRGRRALT